MTSWVELANQALTKLGHTQYITSLTDSSTAAILINKMYLQVRDATLRAHNWGFARKRVQLAASTTEPAFGVGNYFPKPADWIRTVRDKDDPYLEYEEEYEGIRCDTDTFDLIYVAQIDDPNKFDALFIEAYTSHLAAKIAIPLTGEKRLYQAMLAMYEQDLKSAKGIASVEQGFQRIITDDFISNRY